MAAADPHALYRHAEAFHGASRRLLPETGAAPEQVAPYIATSVFALELYLKCLLMLVKGKYPHLHSIVALFYDLPEAEVRRVRKLHREIYRAHFPSRTSASLPADRPPRHRGPEASRQDRDGDPTGAADARLDAILAGAKDAFTVARYMYEPGHDADTTIPDVSVASAAVRGRLLELEPGWAAD